MKDEVEPLDTLGFSPYDVTHPARAVLFPPLQQKVKDMNLWACHLGPELGGPGSETCKNFGTAQIDTKPRRQTFTHAIS